MLMHHLSENASEIPNSFSTNRLIARVKANAKRNYLFLLLYSNEKFLKCQRLKTLGDIKDIEFVLFSFNI